MSRRNGERARFQIKRKARILNRVKSRALRATLVARGQAEAAEAAPIKTSTTKPSATAASRSPVKQDEGGPTRASE